MFELSRDLKRLFAVDGPRDGLTGGDVSLLEMLDLDLLRAEAKAGDIAAGRISARDPSQRRLDAARVWRELARRTGDPVCLRRAAEAADKAAEGFKREDRARAWAAARYEQAETALLAAELFGDEGLNAAAEIALKEVRRTAPSSAAAALAWAQLTRLTARRAMASADIEGVRAAVAAFDGPILALEGHLRTRSVGKAEVARILCERAEILIGAAARLKDQGLYDAAIDGLDKAAIRLDPTHEPLSWARVRELLGAAKAAAGELHGAIEDIASGVEIMADLLEFSSPDHSPLDWARSQHALALALQGLGEATEADRAFEHALGAYDRALWITKGQTALSLRPVLSHNRAGCLARRAELAAEPGMLDEAIDGLKGELSAISASKDPVSWAVAQVNLARLYEARSALPGSRTGERAAAALALGAALEVFGEHGLRSLSDQAARGLERLTAMPRAAVG